MNISEAQRLVIKDFSKLRHPRLGSYIALSEEVGEIADLVMKREFYGEEISQKDFEKNFEVE